MNVGDLVKEAPITYLHGYDPDPCGLILEIAPNSNENMLLVWWSDAPSEYGNADPTWHHARRLRKIA